MQTNIEALQIFDRGLTKNEIKNMASNAVDTVLENGNILASAEALSAMETFIKEVRADERFKSYVRDEASKTPKGYISSSGAKIELAETGTSYNYSQCNDNVLENLESNLETLDVAIKDRKEFLKKLPLSGIETVDKNTGDVVTIWPPSKSSTSSFKVTLAK